MRTSLFTLVLLSLAATANASPDRVVGFWASPDSIFEVHREGETLKGTIRALKDPLYLANEPGPEGTPRLDANNPIEALRERPLVGLEMFSEYRFEDGMWQGKIYDPESGNTYQSRMQLNDDGHLEIRGYIGMPMFGRTATFLPATQCSPSVRDMQRQVQELTSC